jgi:hypothetical protein
VPYVSEVKARTLKRLASFTLNAAALEVNLMEFTRVSTGDNWVKRVVGYMPEVRQYPMERMFLNPPEDWKTERVETAIDVMV